MQAEGDDVVTDPENSPTADWWCWTEDEPSTFHCRELGHDVRPVRKLGDPSTAEWREAAGLPPLPSKWEGADYLERQITRAEQERDALASKLRTAEGERDTWMGQHTKTAQDLTSQRDGALNQWQKEREQHDLTRAELATEVQAHRDVQLRAMRAEAELSSARQENEQLREDGRIFARVARDLNAELEQLRAARQWIVARDGGRYCERCEAEIRRGEAYIVAAGTVDITCHIHCPSPIKEMAMTVGTPEEEHYTYAMELLKSCERLFEVDHAAAASQAVIAQAHIAAAVAGTSMRALGALTAPERVETPEESATIVDANLRAAGRQGLD